MRIAERVSGGQVTSQVIAHASESTTYQTFGAYSPIAHGSCGGKFPPSAFERAGQQMPTAIVGLCFRGSSELPNMILRLNAVVFSRAPRNICEAFVFGVRSAHCRVLRATALNLFVSVLTCLCTFTEAFRIPTRPKRIPDTMTSVKQLFSLEGQTALVTGGTRGIGQSMAIALAEAGADILLVQVGSPHTHTPQVHQR